MKHFIQKSPLSMPAGRRRSDAFTGQIKVLTSCPSCPQGLSRYDEDAGTQADYIVVEIVKRLLGDDWLAQFVSKATNGGIERVLL